MSDLVKVVMDWEPCWIVLLALIVMIFREERMHGRIQRDLTRIRNGGG